MFLVIENESFNDLPPSFPVSLSPCPLSPLAQWCM